MARVGVNFLEKSCELKFVSANIQNVLFFSKATEKELIK